ncbi:MAG: ABC transporter substrate-binding protein [Chloroflexi bacterium]|nr:ABC transporter substrate-binding protein [Chloroflexota bacterium]
MSGSKGSRVSRRTFLRVTVAGVFAGGAMATGLIGACAPAPSTTNIPGARQQKTQVKAMASWLPQGSNLFLFVARDKGFWQSRGLEVAVTRGFGSGDSSKRAALGEQDFVQASMSAQIINNGKGLESIAIAMQVYKLPMGIFVLDDSPIKTPKDLEGKTIGATPTTGDFQLWPAFVQKTGLDGNTVKFQFLGAAVRHPSLIDRKIDALSGYSVTEIPPLMARGIKVRSLLYADHGLEMYDQGILTQAKTVKERPEVVQAFVDGALEAIKFTHLNPAESVDIFINAIKELQESEKNRDAVVSGLGFTNAMGLDPIQVASGMGYMDEKTVTSTIELVGKYMGLDKQLRPSDVFTNQFIGKVKLTEQELEKAKSNVAQYLQFVRS